MNEDQKENLRAKAIAYIRSNASKLMSADEYDDYCYLRVINQELINKVITTLSIKKKRELFRSNYNTQLENANMKFPSQPADINDLIDALPANVFTTSNPSQPNQAPSKESKMDKNLFAIAQDNLITVECRFSTSSNLYTYVTSLKGLQSGDLVIVEGPKSGDLVNAFSSTSNLAVVEVVNVHTSCKIDPEEPFRYKFILGTVNQSCGQQIIKDYTEFYDQINQAYKANMRAQVRAQVKAVIAGQASPEVLGMTKTED